MTKIKLPKAFRLPGGTRTASYDVYLRAWRKLMKPIIKVVKKSGPYYGSAFDPGILIGTLSMTTRQALAFYEALTGAPYKCP